MSLRVLERCEFGGDGGDGQRETGCEQTSFKSATEANVLQPWTGHLRIRLSSPIGTNKSYMEKTWSFAPRQRALWCSSSCSLAACHESIAHWSPSCNRWRGQQQVIATTCHFSRGGVPKANPGQLLAYFFFYPPANFFYRMVEPVPHIKQLFIDNFWWFVGCWKACSTI